MSIATDYDHRVIDAVSVALGGEIGGSDDVDRLLGVIKRPDRERYLAEVAVAFIRWAQDLKARERAFEKMHLTPLQRLS